MGGTAPPAKLNIPGLALLLLAAVKLNPPGAGAAVHRNNKQKERQLVIIDKHYLSLIISLFTGVLILR